MTRPKRVVGIAAVLAAALAMVLACSSPSSGSATGTTACDDFFQALYVQGSCGATLPANELARVKPRFEKLCAAATTLSGTSLTTSAIEACAQALQAAGGCGLEKAPDACKSQPGTLAAGASCVNDAQCASARCVLMRTFSADGGVAGNASCGQCATSAAVGQPCGAANVACTPGAACDSASKTCMAIAIGDVGASCGTSTQQCKSGLMCTSSKCAEPVASGAPCMGFDCATGLTCDGASKTCRPQGAVGAACTSNNDCAAGLACGAMQTCATIAWASAGQPCNATTHCLVGGCTNNGACPAVIADGQPCAPSVSSTCDTFAECINGACAIQDTATCM